MRVRFDKQANALYMRLSEGIYDHSDEISSGVVVDFDADGRVLGFEILDASERVPLDFHHQLQQKQLSLVLG